MITGSPGDEAIIIDTIDAFTFITECNQLKAYDNGEYIMHTVFIDADHFKAVFVRQTYNNSY